MNLRRAIYLLMFFSGALALVYELLWMRRFTALFGASTPAVAATLAAMFLGMGVGSAVIGNRAAQIKRLLRSYGLLEIGIAAGALLVEPMLLLYERIGSASLSLKIVCALMALFLPSFCMGGTVPLLGHALAAESRRLGVKVGGLYAANLFGATAGAFSVPFLWLPNLSARVAYGMCIVLSAAIGITAMLVDRPLPSFAASVSRTPREDMPLQWRAVLLLSLLSGAVLFTLQVLWSRLFAQVHENSIYSFAMVLGVLLIALGFGSAGGKFLLQRGFGPRHLLAFAWVASGLVICFTPFVFYKLSNGLSFIEGSWGGTNAYAMQLLALAAPTVFLPAICAGMALPLLMEMAGASKASPSGRLVGTLLAVNTVGSVIGALLAAFALPKLLGIWTALFASGAVMVLAGAWCARRGFAGIAFVIVVACFTLPKSVALPRAKSRAHENERILHVRESAHGILAVIEKGDSRRIKLNNSYVLGGTASTGDERLQAHIPLLLHPAPKRVAFLGFGTGITAGAALLHPVEHISAIEIVPEVIETARDYFAEANLDVVGSRRAQVMADDARSFLRAATNTFDVIVGDLFVPWHQGEALLYTADQFKAARQRLAPGGVFCQWLPMFQLSEEEFQIIAATFLDIFPQATVWRGDFSPRQPALALIAHTHVDAVTVERRVREMQPDPANPMLGHPAGLWMFSVGPLDPNRPEFRTARRNRADRPWLEILGPLNRPGATGSGFIGDPLNDYLAQIQSAPTASTPFTSVTADHQRWQQAGAGIARASVLLASGRSDEGAKLIEASMLALPAEVQQAFASATEPF